MPKMLLCSDTETSPDITLTGNGSCFELIWGTGHFIDISEYDLSRLEFICESLPIGYFPDFAVSDLGCVVVSERLRNLLTNNGIDNIEYFPATIVERKSESSKPGFFAANIIGLVDCINTDKSEFRGNVVDGEVKAIFRMRSLVLKELEVDIGYIYRPLKFRRLIIIEDRFEKILEDSGIVGTKFILPERWDGFNGEK